MASRTSFPVGPRALAAENGRGDTEPRPNAAGAIFQLLRDGAPRTRADLAAVTGLARSTVAARVDELLATGLVAPTGEAASTGGRPPATFAFRPEARLVLAADIGVSRTRVAVTDLAATVLAEEALDLAVADGPVAVLNAVLTQFQALLERTGRSTADLAGAGVGLPGPVEHSTGHPVSPPLMPGWDGFDVAGFMGRALGTPILVDNDVNIMALGEHAAVWPTVDDLLFVKIATGIGAGIISHGELQRGAQGAAGDLGHIAVPGGPDITCRCGNVGCLEAVASGRAVASTLRAKGYDVSTNTALVELLRSGNTDAALAIREAGRSVGRVLAACVNLLNPSVIVIGGIVADAGEHLLAGIREVVYTRSLPLATQHLRIVGAGTAGRAGVLGAAALVVQHVLAAGQVDQLVTTTTSVA
ncbi:ROK family transcriptional regulator [Georgenia yuyongxinii]|uniref:ROK family transcriptional regulator n=1 Tax=Georgenia yuyongxinii TaxID=2589797 RepID=A0A5B8BZE7_9MICO|nr:ROK family transcriptional regulator [Georgenia yuyongxinii]QDC23694.1 ROK family transcriptional regulator [Georgenia yuyongxinii]